MATLLESWDGCGPAVFDEPHVAYFWNVPNLSPATTGRVYSTDALGGQVLESGVGGAKSGPRMLAPDGCGPALDPMQLDLVYLQHMVRRSMEVSFCVRTRRH